MCKTKIIRDYLEKGKKNYRRIFYAGDGSNDYCPV
jgi:2-hydroxy-3-keto-5-methylthiopentenyl-1-phosphate phosphatase